MRKVTEIALFAFFFFCFSALAEQLTFTGTTNKNPLLYKAGEPMQFTVTLVDRDAKDAPVKGRRLRWNRVGDDGKTEKGEAVSDMPLIVTTKIDKPGFVRLTVHVLDANGRVCNGKNEKFDGGAGADVNSIPSWPIPADFDAFWDRETERLLKTPYEKKLTDLKADRPGVKYIAFSLSMFPGERPATGLLAWPEAAAEKSLDMIVHVTGYGFGRTWMNFNEVSPAKGPGALVLQITRHGEEPLREEAYYKNLQTNVLKSYCFRNNNGKPQDTDFFKMLMRGLRGIQFAKTFPQWNGKSIKTCGGSMGGYQALGLAALDRGVTDCSAFIPWCADFAGKSKFKRLSGWNADYTDALGYCQLANLATRVTCRTTMQIGLGDYVCPPSGEMILFRNLRGEKELKAVQNMGHGSNYGVRSPSYTFKNAIR